MVSTVSAYDVFSGQFFLTVLLRAHGPVPGSGAWGGSLYRALGLGKVNGTPEETNISVTKHHSLLSAARFVDNRARIVSSELPVSLSAKWTSLYIGQIENHIYNS